MYKIFVILLLCTAVACNDANKLDTDCMNWAVKRLVGGSSGEVITVLGTSGNDTRGTVLGEGGIRSGKRGPPGRRGDPGPMGPPGECNCIPQEFLDLKEENEIMKDHINRIRSSDPEAFCLLGMKSGQIRNADITVSSYPSYKTYARLDGSSGSWYPSSTSYGQEWIMVDLKKPTRVTGLITQGRSSGSYWVKTYKVEYGLDGVNFTDVKKSDSSEMIFTGNSDYSSKKLNRFPEPITTRYLRIYPQAFNGHMGIRFDLIDC